jgi:hypothetical protein
LRAVGAVEGEAGFYLCALLVFSAKSLIMPRKTWFCCKFHLICLYLLGCCALAQAQGEKVTLILRGGDEIPCQLQKITAEYVHFKAASSTLRFKYGEFIERTKVAQIRLDDGRTLSVTEFVAMSRSDATPTEKSSTAAPAPAKAELPQEATPATATPAKPITPPPASGPGLRLTNPSLDTPHAQSTIGLRLPDISPPSVSTELEYADLANLIAEAGLAGKLLEEMNTGVLQGRLLTKSQKELVDAISQSAVWIARKRGLHEAVLVVEGEFNNTLRSQPRLLADVFHFQFSSSSRAFVEFVQFLQVENVLHFEDKWQQIVTAFGEEAAAAFRDILNNYDDWHYLFGQEKR